MARLLAAWLPPSTSKAWRRIPRPLALLLHKLEKSVLEGDDDGDERLPLTEPAANGGAVAAAGSGSSNNMAPPNVFVLPVSLESSLDSVRGPVGVDQRHGATGRE